MFIVIDTNYTRETAMAFTEDEVAYLKSQPLARLATVDADGQPDVAPVGFEFDGTYFYVGGRAPERTRKFLNVKAGQVKVALVVDDLVSTDPWTPRFLRVYGTAELTERPGRFGSGPYMRITPEISWSWNLGGRPYGDDAFQAGPQRTVHGRDR
jgi:pyridoxamine 5'-phosphate oxidase family protein